MAKVFKMNTAMNTNQCHRTSAASQTPVPRQSLFTSQHLRRRISASWILPLLLLFALPAALQAQYNYTTNNGTITITGYIGSGGAVTIPSTINGLPVGSIGTSAFYSCTSLTNATIPNSITNVGDGGLQLPIARAAGSGNMRPECDRPTTGW
jgi:hypothetical protein